MKEMDDKFVELTENENITKLCEEVNLSSYLIFLLVWFLLVIFTTGGLLAFTAAVARKKMREMLDDTNSEDDNFLHFDDEEVDMTLYQKIPEEYKSDKRKESVLTSIEEDKESDFEELDEDRDYFPTNSPSLSSSHGPPSPSSQSSVLHFPNQTKSSVPHFPNQTMSRNSLSPIGRSHSTSDCYPGRVSISGSGAGGKIKRTESQNRADYLIKVMARGGSGTEYRSTVVQHKISPTGRKISVDQNQRRQSGPDMTKPNQDIKSDQAKPNQVKVHLYQNLPGVATTVIVKEDVGESIVQTTDF